MRILLFLITVFVYQANAEPVTCAEKIILLAAKKNVAENFGNSPTSSGVCAYGVRTSLQLSSVGGLTDGIGNAIDFVENLPPFGYVASPLMDPNTAAPGAVIIFSGPHSKDYLNDGKFGKPPGDWLGHVTIKGDDKKYYTDARTAEPALGWVNGKNVDKIRNVAVILVPGPDLVKQYESKCSLFDNWGEPDVDENLVAPAVVESCKQQLEAITEARLACLRAAGLEGQDFAPGTKGGIGLCRLPFDYQSCLKR